MPLRTRIQNVKGLEIDAMKWVLVLAAASEAATGVALLVVPSLVVQLLLGEELTGVAIPVARVLGIALIALGVACWPGTPLGGMFLILAYVAYGSGRCCGRQSRCTRSWRYCLRERVTRYIMSGMIGTTPEEIDTMSALTLSLHPPPRFADSPCSCC